MTADVNVLLKYARAQMAAEAIGLEPNMGEGAFAAALQSGNQRSSKFTELDATDFAPQWNVEAVRKNTATGFSGTLFKSKTAPSEYVLSFRSTEFADDAARDNQATNTLEIKTKGWALGQITDMKAWYDTIQSQIPAGSKLVVTGYSLGGHLATAFNLLYPNRAAETYTFNGAGVGVTKDGYSLSQVVSEFSAHRFDNADLFTTQATQEKYSLLRSTFREGASVTSGDVVNGLTVAKALAGSTTGAEHLADQMLVDAVKRIGSVVQEVERVNAGIASGSSDSAPAAPVPVTEVAGASLDYQLAFLRATLHTAAKRPIFDGFGLVAYSGREIAPNPISTLTDVYGDTMPSGVANSQVHHGTPTPVFVEDQPLWRGNVFSGIVKASTAGQLGPDFKLLMQGFAQNDFGDTHSLALLVDSLSTQAAFAKLDPAVRVGISDILRASSHLTKLEDSGQGRAEGDVLENVTKALGTYLGTDSLPNWKDLEGDPNGNTWARINSTPDYSGRGDLHTDLSLIKGDGDFEALTGKVSVQLASPAGLSNARTDVLERVG